MLVTLSRLPAWKDSESLCLREIEINPRSLLAPIHLGKAREDAGDLKSAFELYVKAVQIDRESGLALTNAGLAALELGDKKQALIYFQQATQTRVLKQSIPYSMIAQALSERQNYSAAIEILNKGLQRFQNDPQLMSNMGSIFLRSEENAQISLNWYKKALSINPNHMDGLQGKAFALQKLGRSTEALQTLEKLISIYPQKEIIRKSFMR